MNRPSAALAAAAVSLCLLAACTDGSGDGEENRLDVESALAAIAEAAGTDQVQRIHADAVEVRATMVTETGAEQWTWSGADGEVTSEEIDPSSTPEPRALMDVGTMSTASAALPGCDEGWPTFIVTALSAQNSQGRVQCDGDGGTEETYYLDGEPAGAVEGTDPGALTAEVDLAAAVLGGELAQVRVVTLVVPSLEVVAAEARPTVADSAETCFPVYFADLSGGSDRRLRCAAYDPGAVLEAAFDAEVAVGLQEQSGGPDEFDELRFSTEHGSPVYSVLSLSQTGMTWYDASGTSLIEDGEVGTDLEPGTYEMVAEPSEDCTWYVWEERDSFEEPFVEGARGERGYVELEQGQVLESWSCPFWQAI